VLVEQRVAARHDTVYIRISQIGGVAHELGVLLSPGVSGGGGILLQVALQRVRIESVRVGGVGLRASFLPLGPHLG